MNDALPDDGSGYVAAAYLVFLALVLVYVAIMAYKLTRLDKDLTELNELDRDTFTAAVGSVFEASPWVAMRAWDRRPFGSVAALHDAMTQVVAAAAVDEQLALIRAHPLGTWVTQGDGELIANHVPFLLDGSRGEHGTLVAHVARANGDHLALGIVHVDLRGVQRVELE